MNPPAHGPCLIWARRWAKITGFYERPPGSRAGLEARPKRGAMASKTKVLTEAEIVKMPKSEYMNAAQLRFFRERLLDRHKQLRENAGATTEHLCELSF